MRQNSRHIQRQMRQNGPELSMCGGSECLDNHSLTVCNGASDILRTLSAMVTSLGV